VGDFMLDVNIYGDALRISPEAPVPVLRIKRTEHNAGGAGSVASNIAALGGIALCLGTIGDDKNGQILKDMLADRGAKVDGLLVADGRPTISKQRLIGLAQHRHQQQLFRMDEESTEPLSGDTNERIIEAYKEILKEADAVCLQDHDKALLSEELCSKLIGLAKDAGKKVLVDPCLISDYSKYTGATLITPNRHEASLAVGFEIESREDAEKAAEQLLADFKLEAVVITLDKEGAYLKTSEQSELVPTRPRSVYDVTGAGDMVLATLATALAAECDWRTAVELSNITGGIEVEKFGVATVSIDEIINEIVGQTRAKGGKVREHDSLVQELNWHRAQGEKIVFTNGCFDVIHRGHIEYLQFCKSHGDILVVGLNSDSSVKQIKGPDRPINNQKDRASVLAAMEAVDYVTIFDEPDPLALIEKVKPDVLVKGQDWEDKGVVGSEFVESYGGRVELAPLVEGKSSTSIIEKMKSLWKKH
jgi:D-beta-D-heptose 7-phosphate kinase/D-beta-D-heptose 1-phosphate adenosyltransferase